MTQTPIEELGKLNNCIEKEASKLFKSIDVEAYKPFSNYLIDLYVNMNVPDIAQDLLDLD